MTTTMHSHPRSRTSPGVTRLGAVLLLVAAALSAFMTARHIWALNLPGCGQGGGCDWATSGPYSSFLGISVAAFGCAFFVALLACWLVTSRNGVFVPLLWTTRVGALGSAGFILLMLWSGHLCPYCLVIHIANLSWFILLELANRRARPFASGSSAPIVVAVALFAVILIASKWLEIRETARVSQQQQQLSRESVEKIGTIPPAVVDSPPAATPGATSPKNQPEEKKPTKRFGGRYWSGDPDAPVRIVIFSDYACQLCRRAESTLTRILGERSDVSLSVKQFPMDKDCNSLILGENIHPGACVAARYAEAVGLVGGRDKFWRFHNWLFDRSGQFSPSELDAEINSLGIDRQAVDMHFKSPAVDSMIQADIQDGIRVGLKFTPMIFVNGYEIQGWQTEGAIPAAVAKASQIALAQPRPDDQPVSAFERSFNEWLSGPQYTMILRQDDHIHGLITAPTSIMIYGDMSEPYNASALEFIAKNVPDTGKVVVIYRTFPLQAECNDMVKRVISERGCEINRLIEAASIAGGEPAFRKLQTWLATHIKNLPTPGQLLAEAATACGLTAASLKAALSDPRIDARIGQNVEAAKQLGVNASPTIFVNGRKLADWQTPGLLEKVIKATANVPPPVYKRPQ